ncbi:MAG: response regulator [Candidatus Auribacterota bacterium]|jgi:DNA-binding response OmpR family regulator|nr:response regulator [Candidatus Auribacterota bacterium]
MFRKKVLVVDDEKEITMMITDCLLPEGYEVVTTNEPKKAVQIAIEEEPCIVLLDYSMPGIDGIKVLKEIRENMPEVKIVMVTGAGSEEIAVKAMKSGADDYITKPFSPQNIVKICKSYLDKFYEQFIWLNDKYSYPLDDEVISRYEFLRAGYAEPSLSINKLRRYFNFSRQDFYILDKKRREFGVLGLFDRSLSELEAELAEEGELSPKKRLSTYKEEEEVEFNRKHNCSIETFINRKDPVQVRLEIIRESATSENPNVSLICKKYNLTREVFYQNYRRFQKYGVLGLLDKKKGRPVLNSKRGSQK